ncbi:MAG: hydroxymethylglutaryl-CoA reductase, degradative [Myxococcota bacterium]
MKSYLEGFYKKSVKERQQLIFGEQLADFKPLLKTGGLALPEADQILENVIGIYALPLALAVNFKINNQDQLIPMVLEEPSVVAAASAAAKSSYNNGGFTVQSEKSQTTAQILIKTSEPDNYWKQIRQHRDELLAALVGTDPQLESLGGGVLGLQRQPLSWKGHLVVNLLVDCLDAMGANAVNTYGEKLKQLLRGRFPGQPLAAIITNAFPGRTTRVRAVFTLKPQAGLSASEVQEQFMEIYTWALHDPLRALTNNKGILNGVSAVALACGNDFRATSAAVHYRAFANSSVRPLAVWEKVGKDKIQGTLSLPLALGSVGGMTNFHPLISRFFKFLKIQSSDQLNAMAACAGLANNFSAIKAIAVEGIQAGHMKLHNKKK